MNYDILVIGGGSAGYAAADAAQTAGARVAIADPGPLGGLCILRGCMPSKTILRSAEILSLMRRAKEFGLLPVQAAANLAAINDRKNRLIREFAEYRIGQLRNPRFDLYENRAEFVSPHAALVGTKTLSARNIIIATGSVAADFPIPGLREAGCITSDEALDLRETPPSMIVLGGGPVAAELAQFFARIGARVTLIQRSAHILSKGDEDLARPVEARFREEGMTVYTGTQLLRISRDGNSKTVHFIHEGREKTVAAHTLLQALGRRPNIDTLNLQAAGVNAEKNAIPVNAEMRTNQPHIFAVGDVNGLSEVVHIAIEQGQIAAWNALDPQAPRRFDTRLKMEIVFTDPQVAGIGLSEKDCRAKNIPHLVASYPFADHGKSMCMGEIHGHAKLLCNPKNGEIIGAHIVGPEAAELIHQLAAVMHYRGTVRDMLHIPCYHPTLSEILTYPAEELAEKIET